MMKKFLIALILLMGILTSFKIEVFASPPLPSPADDQTTFSGIIPLEETTLEITQQRYYLEILKEKDLEMDYLVERQGKVDLYYEIYNGDAAQTVTFAFPFISRFIFLPREFEIKVNGQSVEPEILFKNYVRNFKFNEEDKSYSFSDWIKNFSKEKYDLNMIKEYQFQNDTDGYLITITNPKITEEGSLVKTTVNVTNASSDALFVDLFQSKIFSSEEVGYFFVSEDVEIECESVELEDHGQVLRPGKLLEPAQVQKEPVSLSSYLNKGYLDNYSLGYKSAFEKAFFHTIDSYLEYRKHYNNSPNYWLGTEYDRTLNDYYCFSLEFSAEFSAESITEIEISYEMPVFAIYLGRYKESRMELSFFTNPGNHWKSVSSIELIVNSDEKIRKNTADYTRTGNEYHFILDENNEIETIAFSNSKVVHNCWGCIGTVESFFTYWGLCLIIALVIRRKKS